MTQTLLPATPHTFVADGQIVHVPAWVVNLDSFRRWARSDEFPEEGRICYLAGEVWVDLSMEQLFTHNQVKQEFNRVLGTLIKANGLGRYLPDGMRLTHVAANISCEPDAAFVSVQAFQTNRVRLIEGAKGGYVELEGTPDVVLEILSDSSERKDAETLPELYWRAAISEYWRVDVRAGRLEFDVLRHGDKGYIAARKSSGWLRSKVFGKSFRLTGTTDTLGHPEYTLEMR